MGSASRTRPNLPHLRFAAPRPIVGLLLATGWIAALVAVDLWIDDRSSVLIGPLAAAPLFTALFAGPSLAALAGGIAFVVAAMSPVWDVGATVDTGYYARLMVIASAPGFAIVSAWYRQRAAARAARLRLLDAVGAVADGSLPLAETLRRVTEVIVPAFGDLCIVDSIREGRATRLAVRARGRADADEVERRLAAREPSLPQWLVTGERHWRQIPRWRPRVREEELRRMAHSRDDLAFLRSLRIRSSIVVPIRARDRNLGTLTLISAWSGRRYAVDDLHFAQILAGRIALALDNAGLFSDLESFERRMDTVMSIIDEAVVIHGPDDELIFANPAAARVMGFASAEEALDFPLERIGERFGVRDEHGFDIDAAAFAGRPARHGEAAKPATLRLVDRATGVERWYRRRSRPIERPDRQPLYFVTVIEDVTDVKRAEFSQRLLARTGELLSHSADYRRMLDDVAHILVPQFADWCSVHIRRADGAIEQAAISHRDPDLIRFADEIGTRYPPRVDQWGPLAEALTTGEPRLIAAITPEMLRERSVDEQHLALLRSLGMRSVILAPMLVGGRTLGVLAFVNQEGSRRFDAEDLEIAVEAARRAGLAIENARIADERARIADALQRELLPPSVPTIPGWQIETMYEPAGELNEVGGDFYEVFPIENGWAVVLGDVSGKGAAAASLTAEARHTLRTAGQLAADPQAGLRLLDENLRVRDDTALCSVAMLVLPDQRDGASEIYAYLAGHPHPLLLRGDSVEPLGRPGPALGVVEGARWDAVPVKVLPGDQIVLYTDGVIEAGRRGGPRFGLDRLRERIAGAGEPEAVIAGVRAALDDFLSGETEDDAALVVVRRTSPAGGRPPRIAAEVPAGVAAGANRG